MDKKTGLIALDNPKNLAQLLNDPVKIAELISGVLISDTNDLKLSAGKVVQAAIKSKFFRQLGEEIKDYQEKGRINEDYLTDPKKFESLQEMLDFIDTAPPDSDRFNAMKRLFLKSIEMDASIEDQILMHHFMKICKELDSGHLLILKAAYDIANRRVSKRVAPEPNNVDLRMNHAAGWVSIIANQVGHGLGPLVEMHENKLVDLKIITSRRMTDNSGIEPTDHFRLTDMGYKLGAYLYE